MTLRLLEHDPHDVPMDDAARRKSADARCSSGAARLRLLAAFALAGLLLGPASAAAFTLVDSLKDGAPKGNPVGGSFGPEGWVVTDRKDRLWYAIPPMPEGAIEFTITGMSYDNMPLADHEIFAMYEAGHGITEPIPYNPPYRDNHYKVMVRVYGQGVPERLGEQKFLWGMCPAGAPGYGDCLCPKQFPVEGDGWWGGNPVWDGSPTRLRIEWKSNVARFYRDAVEVTVIDYSGSGLPYGPFEPHFVIGAPRSQDVQDAGMPVGAVISDVFVEGVEGPIQTCAGPLVEPDDPPDDPPDAGPGEPGDPTGCDPAAPIDALTFAPTTGAGDAQIFQARFVHCEGASLLRVVSLLVGEPVPGTPSVQVGYEAGRLSLEGSSCESGEQAVLHGPYGDLDCGLSGVALEGDELSVAWALRFDVAGFAGLRGVHVDAKGGTTEPEPRLGWTKVGEFTVQAGPPDSPGSGEPPDTSDLSDTSGPLPADVATPIAPGPTPDTGRAASQPGQEPAGGGFWAAAEPDQSPQIAPAEGCSPATGSAAWPLLLAGAALARRRPRARP